MTPQKQRVEIPGDREVIDGMREIVSTVSQKEMRAWFGVTPQDKGRMADPEWSPRKTKLGAWREYVRTWVEEGRPAGKKLAIKLGVYTSESAEAVARFTINAAWDNEDVASLEARVRVGREILKSDPSFEDADLAAYNRVCAAALESKRARYASNRSSDSTGR